MKPKLILLPGMLCDWAYYEPQLADLQQIADVSIAASSAARFLPQKSMM